MSRKRKQQKLVLTEYEIPIIKGLIEHTDLNNQTIVAIFSHKSRTINHREIGYFRDSNNKKYRNYPTANKSETKQFLLEYGKLDLCAKQIGITPIADCFQLVQKACEAMKSAVAIYNSPTIYWKSEIFIVNAIIAWTYMMHAFYMTRGIDFYYSKNGNPILTEDGRPKHWELSKCLNVHECELPDAVKSNLRYLITIRNEVEHCSSENIDHYTAPKLQACALNFDHWLCEWFGAEYSIANELSFVIQFAQISLERRDASRETDRLPRAIQAANSLIENEMDPSEYDDPRYSFRVFVIPKTINNPKKADQAVTYAKPGSALEMAVREVERPKYTATQIVNILKDEGFTDFSLHGRGGFVDIWKALDGKNPGKGLGVSVAKYWYWYDAMVVEVRKVLSQRQKNEQWIE